LYNLKRYAEAKDWYKKATELKPVTGNFSFFFSFSFQQTQPNKHDQTNKQTQNNRI